MGKGKRYSPAVHVPSDIAAAYPQDVHKEPGSAILQKVFESGNRGKRSPFEMLDNPNTQIFKDFFRF